MLTGRDAGAPEAWAWGRGALEAAPICKGGATPSRLRRAEVGDSIRNPNHRDQLYPKTGR